MSFFTDQKPRIVTEKDLNGMWYGGKKGKYFRCSLCGYKFQLGDYWRFVYAGNVHLANLLVCKNCDDENEKVLKKWKVMHEEIKTKYWYFVKNEEY